LGEFGGYFTLGSFVKIAEEAQNFWLIFPPSLDYALILTKHGSGYILGDFVTNSSGHPEFVDICFPSIDSSRCGRASAVP
jgi:hypothetical protein